MPIASPNPRTYMGMPAGKSTSPFDYLTAQSIGPSAPLSPSFPVPQSNQPTPTLPNDIYGNSNNNNTPLPLPADDTPYPLPEVTDPSQIKDARTLLAHLQGNGVSVSKAEGDAIDSENIAHFNTDEAGSAKVEKTLNKLRDLHPDAQVGHIKLADGRMSVLFAPADSDKTTRQTASEFLDSLQDHGERALYTHTLNDNIQKLKAGQAQLASFSAQAVSEREASQSLESQANDLLREARSVIDRKAGGTGPQWEQEMGYAQRQADRLTTQARELKGQAEQKKYTAKEFLARQKSMKDQLDQYEKAAPENAMAAVEENRMKIRQQRQNQQFTAQLHKQSQTAPIVGLHKEYRASLGQINRDLTTLINRKKTENPVTFPDTSGMDVVSAQKAMQKAKQDQQTKIDKDPDVLKLKSEQQFYQQHLEKLKPAMQSLVGESGQKQGYDMNAVNEQLKAAGLDPNDPQVQQALQEELLGGDNEGQ